MRHFKYLLLLAFVAVPAVYSQAQVAIGVQVGPAYGYYDPPPVCEYGFYPYYPYACAPYGYWGPDYFVDGVFIGVGPWYRWYYTHPAFYRGYYRGWDHGFRGGWDHDRGFRGGNFHDRGFRDRDFHERGRGGNFAVSRGGGNFHDRGFHGGGESHARGGGGEFHGGGGHGGGHGGGGGHGRGDRGRR